MRWEYPSHFFTDRLIACRARTLRVEQSPGGNARSFTDSPPG